MNRLVLTSWISLLLETREGKQHNRAVPFIMTQVSPNIASSLSSINLPNFPDN